LESWDTYADIIGGASAALLGLLFIAISLRIDIVTGSAELRKRAAQTLVLFTIVLLVSILLAIPSQPSLILGIEVMTLAVLSAVGLTLLNPLAGGLTSQQRIGRVLKIVLPNTGTTVILFVSGLLLALGWDAGRYLMVAPVITAFVGGLASAWLIMTRIDDDEPKP